ncbi:MAG TPA: hypothetical protein VLG50_02620 [Candidatus Saccharimonadales bacterium]|nr:hypothetical protein [Candidatus Saccharimonadales bacterium]
MTKFTISFYILLLIPWHHYASLTEPSQANHEPINLPSQATAPRPQVMNEPYQSRYYTSSCSPQCQTSSCSCCKCCKNCCIVTGNVCKWLCITSCCLWCCYDVGKERCSCCFGLCE